MRLQRLNMDNSWHIRLGNLGLLVDPWLEGEEVDYFRWFNTQWHRTAPLPYEDLPDYQLVLITQKYADHCHMETLQRLSPMRVVAPRTVVASLKQRLPDSEFVSLNHTEDLYSLQGLRVRYLPTRRRFDPIYDAFVIDDGNQSVFIAPHGFELDSRHLQVLREHSPISLLLSPLNRYVLPGFLGGVIAPGLDALRQLAETLKPDYIAQTHDEDKVALGIVRRFAKVERFDQEQLGQHPWLREKLLNLPNYQPVNL